MIGYNGKISFNKKYPNGVIKKNLDNIRIKKLGWRPKIKLNQGLKIVISSLRS